MALRERHQRFCDEYIKDLNGTQSAIRAGFSESGAAQRARELLSRPEVQSEIVRLKADRSKETGIDAAWLLRRLSLMADARVSDAYDPVTGDLLSPHEWPEGLQLLASGLEVTTMSTTVNEGDDAVVVGLLKKFRIETKSQYLKMIGQHIDVGALREVHELTGDIPTLILRDYTGGKGGK